MIETEALAGTRARGHTPEADTRLAGELLSSRKEQREHGFVVDGIRSAMRGLCEVYSENDSSPELMKLSRVQHLCTRIRGELAKDVDDADILGSLHPTPAVGAYPTQPGLDLINRLEPFQRGWYSGPVGWVSRDGADFAVAIRSALIRESQLHLYSGVGIVEGSLADQEWREMEGKIAGLLSIFETR